MKAKLYITFLFCCASFLCSYAQIIPPTTGDSIVEPPKGEDFNKMIEQEMSKASNTPVEAPRTSSRPTVDLDTVKVSEESLDAAIDYNSKDSMWFDVENETVFLFGDAFVTYNSLKVTADYIEFNMADNIVLASGYPDSVGTMSGYPVFEEKDQKFDAKKIRYNFQTNKGIIYDATTIEKDLYVLGEKAAFFGENKDQDQREDVVFSEDAIFTTCSHPYPHFGIRSKKQKVIPNDVVVVGPSNLELGGIGTPIWLPFAFFPLTDGPRTGLIFPQDYEYSDAWGFGLKDVGWYFPMGEYKDLTLKGMIYTRGTWGLNASMRYKKLYKYSGTIGLGFSDRKVEQQAQRLSQKSWSLRISHNQDSKAHPTRRFSASANIQTNNFQSLNQNDAQSVLQNTLTSSITYNQSFPGKPYSISASLNHSQNTLTRKMDITFPSFNFNMNRIYPFKRKNTLDNKEKWFEKVSFQYKAVAQNRFSTTDTTLFSRQTLEDARFGIKHTANSNASFRVLKYFNLTPSVDYKEIWYFDRTRKVLENIYTVDSTTVQTDPLIEIDPMDPATFRTTLDTTQYGEIATLKDFGFNPLRLFSTGVSLGTQIFGVRQFSKGKLRGIRHVIKPSVSFNYTPDYTSDRFGYFDYVDTDLRPEENDPIRYSLFESGIYDDAPTGGKQMAMGYRLNNIFEAKYWSDRDSSTKNFKLFDNIVTSGNYNFAADSLKWSVVRTTGTTRFFNGKTTFNFSTEFDPYSVDEDGRRINVLHREAGGGYLRYVRTNFRINTGITIKEIVSLFSKKKKEEKPRGEILEQPKGPPEGGQSERPTDFGSQRTVKKQSTPDDESLLDLFSNWRISHNLIMESTADTFFIRTNSIQTSGSIKLTNKWDVRFGNISYDFQAKRLIYPTLGFARDLHCWQMGMDWYPARGTFSFFLKVKPGSLEFIKVPYGRNNQDSFRGF